jgi:hypothetical protein
MRRLDYPVIEQLQREFLQDQKSGEQVTRSPPQ